MSVRSQFRHIHADALICKAKASASAIEDFDRIIYIANHYISEITERMKTEITEGDFSFYKIEAQGLVRKLNNEKSRWDLQSK